MSEDEKVVAEQGGSGEEDPRRQLWVRAGVAGGLIALLLGGLALFDESARPPEPTEARIPSKPIAPAPVATQGTEPPPDVVRAGSETTTPDKAAAAPEGSAPPSLPPADKGEKLAKQETPVEETRPVTKPVAASEGVVAGAPKAAAAPLAPAGQAPGASVRADAAKGVPAVAPVTGMPPAVSAPVPSAPPVAVPAPAPASSPTVAHGGYLLHLGVFTTPASAEELRTRLSINGIPSQLESRVVVGPFADRKDALAAQARLRALGAPDSVLVPPARR